MKLDRSHFALTFNSREEKESPWANQIMQVLKDEGWKKCQVVPGQGIRTMIGAGDVEGSIKVIFDASLLEKVQTAVDTYFPKPAQERLAL